MHKHGNFNREWNSPKQTQICRQKYNNNNKKENPEVIQWLKLAEGRVNTLRPAGIAQKQAEK